MTDAAQPTGDEALAAAGARPATLAQAAAAGLRQPIVAILLQIALFTTVSGKPLDGFLMLTVAVLLVWDAARTRLAGAAGPAGLAAATVADGPGFTASIEPAVYLFSAAPARSALALVAQGQPEPATQLAGAAASRRKPRLIGTALGAAGLLYAVIVGSFSRYSWPATIAVVALGCLMVAIGWQGPLRQREALTGVPLRRSWLWAVVLVTGGLWELSSLLQQPHLTTDSYAHPTISALTDPLLASHPGRSIALGAWLLIGWFVVGR